MGSVQTNNIFDLLLSLYRCIYLLTRGGIFRILNGPYRSKPQGFVRER
jgi:hypothetical protein